MDADYPAAHSMDTQWFAVDERGHVGLFHSGESGPVPDGLADESDFWSLVVYLAPQTRDLDEIVAAGVFTYENSTDHEIGLPYEREGVPVAPLHRDQLPYQFRSLFTLQLPGRFDDAERIQPAESHPCYFWLVDSVGYLCGDGVTIKPLPGMEEKCAAYIRQWCAESPDDATRFRFEMPPEEDEGDDDA